MNQLKSSILPETAEVLRDSIARRWGFLTTDEIITLISDPATVDMILLVRRGAGREKVPANRVLAYITKYRNHPHDYIRDVCIPASLCVQIRKELKMEMEK